MSMSKGGIMDLASFKLGKSLTTQPGLLTVCCQAYGPYVLFGEEEEEVWIDQENKLKQKSKQGGSGSAGKRDVQGTGSRLDHESLFKWLTWIDRHLLYLTTGREEHDDCRKSLGFNFNQIQIFQMLNHIHRPTPLL